MDAGPVRRTERGRTAFIGEARPESVDRARAATLPADSAERWLMNVLLVYPEFPETFWSFKHALKFLGKPSAQPPLGLMTVAALLPGAWKKRLVDTNVEQLRDRDLKWADVVFVSGMHIQLESMEIGRAHV